MKLLQCDEHILMFNCPGCNDKHSISYGSGNPNKDWQFNGNWDMPSFRPSIKVTGLQTVRDGNGKWSGGWVRDAQGNTVPFVCHSFVTDGMIQFLGDCTHSLAGQTVPLPEFDA